MDRRAFLKTAATGALASAVASSSPATAALPAPAAGARRLKLSCTWWPVSKLSVHDALAVLQKYDYDAFEMFDWRKAKTLDAVAAELKNFKLECATLVANKGVEAPGCGLVNPKERDAFLNELNLSIEAARRVNCKRLVVLTGNELPGVSRDTQMQASIAGLKAAAPILERNGITAVIEILNTYVDHKGYFLYTVNDGARLVDGVGSPNVKLLFDIYHVQIMEGNLISNIRANIERIGHFHIGDVPGRHQPGTGEINYRNVFKAILDTGKYDGFAALEYGATVPLEQDLKAQRELTTFA